MKKQFDYSNKCGSCKYFCFCTNKGEVVRHGICDRPDRLKEVHHHYTEATTRACRKYEVEQ